MDNQQQHDFAGNIQKALSTSSKIDANKVLQEAFDTTKTRRKPLVSAILWASLIMFAAFMLVYIIANALNIDTEAESFSLAYTAIQVFIWTPLLAGLQIVALRVVTGRAAIGTQVFDYLKQPWALIATAVIAALIMQLPMLVRFPEILIMLWAIFLQIAFSLNLLLVAGAKVSPLNGVYYSFLLVSKRFFGFFIIHLAMFLLLMLALIPGIIAVAIHAAEAGNPLIIGILAAVSAYLVIAWVMPTYYHAIAVCYRDVLGISQQGSSNTDELSEPSDDNDEFTA